MTGKNPQQTGKHPPIQVSAGITMDHSNYCTDIRDGPKFGRRHSSARFGNMWLFGRTSASFVALHLRVFALATGVN